MLLAVSGVDDVTTLFKSDGNGIVTIEVRFSVSIFQDNYSNLEQARNDGPKAGVARVIVALGDNFESANCAAMYHARDIVQGMFVAIGEDQRELETLKEDIKPQWMENWFDGLTYCLSLLQPPSNLSRS